MWIKPIICKWYLKECKYIEREKNGVRYFFDDLEISSVDSDEENPHKKC